MAQFINTNIASLNTQRNLNSSQSSLAISLQRLSSGLRINSAKDDAAGMAISERMGAQIKGMNQATRNANDGISLAQTAEGALQEVTNNLQRIRELAVQSANGSNSATDRAALNNEATQLISEINRVANSASFNGVQLLDGTFTAQAFQVGANSTSNDVVTISSIASAKTTSLGVGTGSSYATALTVAGATTTSNAIAAAGLTINGYGVGAAASDGVSYSGATASAIAKAAQINAITGSTNVSATVVATAVTGVTLATAATSAIAGDGTDYVKINGVTLGAILATAASTATVLAGKGSQIAAAVNTLTAQTGVTATFSTTTGAVSLSAADGRNISIEQGGLGTAAGLTAATNIGGYTLSSTSSAGVTVSGSAAGLTSAGLTAGYTAATVTTGAGVSSLDLTTASGATSALTIIDAALTTVNSSRASLGAYQNRFSSAVNSLQTSSENLSTARARIRDADFAAETSALTRAQVLQQAGIAILSQANSAPQSVLSLLR